MLFNGFLLCCWQHSVISMSSAYTTYVEVVSCHIMIGISCNFSRVVVNESTRFDGRLFLYC
jgi:hypothetical protein